MDYCDDKMHSSDVIHLKDIKTKALHYKIKFYIINLFFSVFDLKDIFVRKNEF